MPWQAFSPSRPAPTIWTGLVIPRWNGGDTSGSPSSGEGWQQEAPRTIPASEGEESLAGGTCQPASGRWGCPSRTTLRQAGDDTWQDGRGSYIGFPKRERREDLVERHAHSSNISPLSSDRPSGDLLSRRPGPQRGSGTPLGHDYIDLTCLGQRKSRPVAASVAADSKFGLVGRSGVGALPIRQTPGSSRGNHAAQPPGRWIVEDEWSMACPAPRRGASEDQQSEWGSTVDEADGAAGDSWVADASGGRIYFDLAESHPPPYDHRSSPVLSQARSY